MIFISLLQEMAPSDLTFSMEKKTKMQQIHVIKTLHFQNTTEYSHGLICILFTLVRAGKSKPVPLSQFLSIIFTVL